jgi:hypothetical protein
MWRHQKYKTPFIGRYNRTKKGAERVFELVNTKTGRVITFESFHAAKKAGWEKTK